MLRDRFKIRSSAVNAPKTEWQGATRENILHGSSTEEQRRQTALGALTLRATDLLGGGGVVAGRQARCGDCRSAPPCPRPKSLVAAPLPILKQPLKPTASFSIPSISMGGGARGGVSPTFREVGRFIYRIGCLRVPLSIILSPRFAGGARKPEALGLWMRLKWPIPSRLEMVSKPTASFFLRATFASLKAEMRPKFHVAGSFICLGCRPD